MHSTRPHALLECLRVYVCPAQMDSVVSSFLGLSAMKISRALRLCIVLKFQVILLDVQSRRAVRVFVDVPSNQSFPLSTPLQPILWPMSSTRTSGTTDMSCKHASNVSRKSSLGHETWRYLTSWARYQHLLGPIPIRLENLSRHHLLYTHHSWLC